VGLSGGNCTEPGESGSGKTTLARLMMGQTQPSSGSVLCRGRDLAHMPGQERFHKPPLYIPDQDRAVACFLYQGSQHLETPDVAQVLR